MPHEPAEPEAPSLESRKERGAYFTPDEVARFICAWAIRSPADRVLEPSCGEAAFLAEAVKRLRELGLQESAWRSALQGHEIHSESAAVARALLADLSADANIEIGDFFAREPRLEFDAVIGNPPYVRYQRFGGEPRARALAAALRQGVRLTGLASSWAAFAVHASAFLKPTGRLGLVLPAELLAVKYAAEIRRFLLGRFARVRLVLFDRLVFPGVLEDVVLLLAEGSGGTDRFEVYQAARPQDLMQSLGRDWVDFHPRPNAKWTSALLPGESLGLYHALLESDEIEPLARWGVSFLGMVTGNNGYFALSPARAKELKLRDSELLPISPPGGRHLTGLELSAADWSRLGQSGASTLLFAPTEKPSKAARRYIADGEREAVAAAYKCRMRTPWWRVPPVGPADLLCTYMSHRQPRLVANRASVAILNSVYGIRLAEPRRDLGLRLLPLAAMNTLTLLGAELGGRAYGGGLLKHEPREIDALPVPSLKLTQRLAEPLGQVAGQVAQLLARGEDSRATALVDEILLRDGLGLAPSSIATLCDARESLLRRRLERGRSQSDA